LNLSINKNSIAVPAQLLDATLLSFIRDHLGLNGTKFGCGKGLCGACTVHIDGMAMRSCQVAVGDVIGQNITTIEGLAGTTETGALHPVQKAWIEDSVPQCGYCQPGQIMTAAALLARNANPTEDEIRDEMSSNLCRCGTYGRIQRAIARAAKEV